MAHIVSPYQKKHARALLRKIGAAHTAGQKKRVKYWGCAHLKSSDAKLMATLKGYLQMKAHRRPDKAELQTIANGIDPWKGTNEEVRWRLERKSSNPNDYRVIMDFGIENRALQYLVRGLLDKVFEPHPCQYLLRGGVKAAVYQLAKAMAEGPVCAYELDITNCYQSFDGKKLVSLIPLPKEVTERVVISEHLNLKGATNNIYDLFGAAGGSEQDSVELMTALADAARRGLPQGSAVSPIVAEMVLSLSLNAIPALGMVFAYADNVLLLAATESNAVAMEKALSSTLEGHPVGRLKPKTKFFATGEPVDFVGHRVTRVNGKPYIEPTPQNQEKFEAQVTGRRLLLQQKLSPKERAQVGRDLKKYVESWTSAFSLCNGIEQIRLDALKT
jgi:Reverse transcriptase (RNA-dependent DNA polymerase)